MTPSQKAIVQETWRTFVPMKEQAVEAFYDKLFTDYPEVRPMFKGDMQTQGTKFMTMLGQAVVLLDDFEVLAESLRHAGRTHSGYGVVDSDYDKVGTCLLWTLKQGLGEAYNADVEDAWATIYQTLASVMIDATHDETAS